VKRSSIVAASMACATTGLLATSARAADHERPLVLSGSFGVGALSFRGDDVGPGFHTGILGSFVLGARFPIGLRPELGASYATFGEGASAKESNLFVLSPGMRWYASSGRIQPWLGAHLDFAWFSWGGRCTVYDQAGFGPPPSQRGCNDNGGYFGFDAGGGVDWRVSDRWSVGTQLSWARVAPTNPPKQEPAPPGFPQREEPSLTRTWITWTLNATFVP
jgi:hypothetical protein